MTPAELASIHASALAIFLAVITAFLFQRRSRLEAADLAVFAQIDRVNHLEFPLSSPLPKAEVGQLGTRESRIMLSRELLRLASSREDGEVLGDAVSARKTFRILSGICAAYPFPRRVHEGPEAYHLGPMEPLEVTSVVEAEKWCAEAGSAIDTALRAVELSVTLQCHAAALDAELEEPVFWVSETMTIVTAGGDLQVPHVSTRRPTATESLESWQTQLREARDILGSTRSALLSRRFHARRSWPRWVRVSLISAGGIAFLGGVVLPMVWSVAPTLFTMWVPIVVYCASVILLVFAEVKQLPVA